MKLKAMKRHREGGEADDLKVGRLNVLLYVEVCDAEAIIFRVVRGRPKLTYQYLLYAHATTSNISKSSKFFKPPPSLLLRDNDPMTRCYNWRVLFRFLLIRIT